VKSKKRPLDQISGRESTSEQMPALDPAARASGILKNYLKSDQFHGVDEEVIKKNLIAILNENKDITDKDAFILAEARHLDSFDFDTELRLDGVLLRGV